MHVFTGLQKLFKARKAYIREEEHAKGYGKVSKEGGYIEKVTRGSRVGGNRWKAGCIGGSGVETGGNVYLDMESG